MLFTFELFFRSILLGIGLAMDAFSVSLANGLSDSGMKKRKMCAVAGIFAVFQFAMPLIGWVCVSTIADCFKSVQKFIPFIALVLLLFIGGKMLVDSIRQKGSPETEAALNFGALLVQGVATSIDALSVGFTIAHYNLRESLTACLIIGIVTFFICLTGIAVGKAAGTRLAGKAGIFGGVILIFIGIEIFVTGLF